MYSDMSNESMLIMNLVLFIPAGYYLIAKLIGELSDQLIVQKEGKEHSKNSFQDLVIYIVGIIIVCVALGVNSVNVAKSLPYTLNQNMPEYSATFLHWVEQTKRSAINAIVVDEKTGEEIGLNVLNISDKDGTLSGGEKIIYASLKGQGNVVGYILDYQNPSTGKWVHLGYPVAAEHMAQDYQNIMLATLFLNGFVVFWNTFYPKKELARVKRYLFALSIFAVVMEAFSTIGSIVCVWLSIENTIPVIITQGGIISTTISQLACWMIVAYIRIWRKIEGVSLKEILVTIKGIM